MTKFSFLQLNLKVMNVETLCFTSLSLKRQILSNNTIKLLYERCNIRKKLQLRYIPKCFSTKVI